MIIKLLEYKSTIILVVQWVNSCYQIEVFLKDPCKKKNNMWCAVVYNLPTVSKLNITLYFTAVSFITSLFSEGKIVQSNSTK